MSDILYSKYQRPKSKRFWLFIAAILVLGVFISHELEFRYKTARETERRELRNWQARNCIPQKPNERGIIEVRQDGSTQCARYENAGYGRTPKLVFAEVYEPVGKGK